MPARTLLVLYLTISVSGAVCSAQRMNSFGSRSGFGRGPGINPGGVIGHLPESGGIDRRFASPPGSSTMHIWRPAPWSGNSQGFSRGFHSPPYDALPRSTRSPKGRSSSVISPMAGRPYSGSEPRRAVAHQPPPRSFAPAQAEASASSVPRPPFRTQQAGAPVPRPPSRGQGLSRVVPRPPLRSVNAMRTSVLLSSRPFFGPTSQIRFFSPQFFSNRFFFPQPFFVSPFFSNALFFPRPFLVSPFFFSPLFFSPFFFSPFFFSRPFFVSPFFASQFLFPRPFFVLPFSFSLGRSPFFHPLSLAPFPVFTRPVASSAMRL
jgi:hypothetical protein